MNRIALVIFILFVSTQFVTGQIELGIKAGANASRSIFDNKLYNRFNDSKYKPGFLVGIVGVFNHATNDKYALQTEITFAKIGRKVENAKKLKPNVIVNSASYNYLQLPIMFRMRFKQPQFDWYVNLGPQISYWFGGKGTYGTFDSNRQIINEYEYTINFAEPKDDVEYMNVSQYNEFQLGLVVGGGILLKPNDAEQLMVSLRYHFGHSYMGEFDGGAIPRIGYTDNFESTNQTLELAVAYTFDLYKKIKIIRKNLN